MHGFPSQQYLTLIFHQESVATLFPEVRTRQNAVLQEFLFTVQTPPLIIQ